MKPRLDSIATCQECGGVICHADGSLSGLFRLEKDWQERGLSVDRLSKEQIRLKRQDHHPNCPRHRRFLEEAADCKAQLFSGRMELPRGVPEAI